MSVKLCACGCGNELRPDAKWKYIMGHKTKTAETGKRVCGCGCGTPLVNRHPYIKGHAPDAAKAATNGKPKPAQRAAKATPRTAAGAIPPPDGVVTLCVRESHLNDFLLKLSLEEKTSIVQRHLEGA